ncbi:MAG: hypothetical protein R3E66_22475 [bacterium]
MARTSGNLPKPLTPFVGRTEDLATVRSLFAQGHRLVTVLGPGGAGKTRLVSEFGHASGAEFDSLWFLDLTPFESADDALAAAMGLFGISSSGAPEHAIARHLDSLGKPLLIIDNLEHMIGEFAPRLAEFMRVNKNAKVLATSREPLHIVGEHQHRLSALSLDEALELFESRARAQSPDFKLDSASRKAIVEVVERVDFLPLAIELAASRARMMTPLALAERLTNRMSALKSKDRDRPERHRTIAATIEWSWELLDDNLRRALTDISVVRGPFDVEVAAAIFADPDAEEMVEGLLDQCLLERVVGGRFRMFETVRGFATDRLSESDHARVVWRRHARYYVQKVESAKPKELASMRHVVPNLLVAAERDIDLDLRAACWVAAGRVSRETGGIAQLVSHLSQVHELTNDPGRIAEATYLMALGNAELLRLNEAVELAAQAGQMAEQNGHMDIAALAHAAEGAFLSRLSRPTDALPTLEHAYEIASRSKDADVRLRVRAQLASTLFQMGQSSRGEALMAENISEANHLGDKRTAARGLAQLALSAMSSGALERAETMLLDAENLLASLDDPIWLATTQIGRGDLDRRRGKLDSARAHYERAVHTAQASSSVDLQVRALSGLAMTLGAAADRGYLITALERVGEESDSTEANLLRSRMAFFDLAFDNPPLSRHAARLVFQSESVSVPWRAVMGGIYAIGYAMTYDGPAFDDVLEKSRALMAPSVFAEAFLDAVQSVGDAMMERRKFSPTAYNELMEEVVAISAMPDPALGPWPQWEAGAILELLFSRRVQPDSKAISLRISEDGRTFYPPGTDEPVDFTRRGALRLILVGLATNRVQNPGSGISLDDVVELGWPGERVTPEAAASRVYTAIRTLRGFGLEDYLLTSDEGYYLSTELGVEFI